LEVLDGRQTFLLPESCQFRFVFVSSCTPFALFKDQCSVLKQLAAAFPPRFLLE
jgi:hypothetical protein